MLQKMIDDFKDSTGTAMRLTSFALAVAICSFITLAFLCAAAFVYVLEHYGLLDACLAGAGVFFAAALIASICYAVSKRNARRKPVEQETSPLQSALTDPMVLAMGLQVVRSVGARRLIPLLAIAGVAVSVGLMAQRHRTDKPDQNA
jgi:hypothetical protein